MNNMFSKAAIWLVIAFVLFTVFKQFDSQKARGNDVPYSQFMAEARAWTPERAAATCGGDCDGAAVDPGIAYPCRARSAAVASRSSAPPCVPPVRSALADPRLRWDCYNPISEVGF